MMLQAIRLLTNSEIMEFGDCLSITSASSTFNFQGNTMRKYGSELTPRYLYVLVNIHK